MKRAFSLPAVLLSLLTLIAACSVSHQPPVSAAAASAPALGMGVDCNYALEMGRQSRSWTSGGKAVEPLAFFGKSGCRAARIRLWVGEDGVNQLHFATETALAAQRAGLKPYAVLFLSDQWADYVKQPVPAAWQKMEYGRKVEAVRAYAETAVRHMIDKGVAADVFEIGNEIDFGICGEFEEEWPHRISVEYMRQKVWPRMWPLIAAAQAGVKAAAPQAKFILHLTQWENVEYCNAFWTAAVAAEVQVDYAGLSYFPTWTDKTEHHPLAYLKGQAAAIVAGTGRPVVICESGYPSTAKFGGQFASWNNAVAGYPLSETGQARWIADFAALIRSDANFAGAFYWSPEWYGGGLWDAFALFDAAGEARPGALCFASVAATSASAPADDVLREVATPAAAKAVQPYFGNLHSHTGDSDGTGTPEEAFAFARDTAKLDFLAVTDHNHMLGGEKATPEEREKIYSGSGERSVVGAAAKATKDGSFLALYGQEFSTMSKGNHVNVFDVPKVIDAENGRFDQLLTWLHDHPDSTRATPIVQFNHPGLTWPQNFIGKTMYGRDDFGGDAGWVEKMGQVTPLIEIINGEPAKDDPKHRAPQQMENFYREFLKLGFRVAPTGNQDNHHKEWGTCTDARTVILAKELTRPALLEALRQRHVYASEDKNLRVAVTVNGHLCGDVLETGGAVNIALQVSDPDEPKAHYTVEAIRGGVTGPPTVTGTAPATGPGVGNIAAPMAAAETVKTVSFEGDTRGFVGMEGVTVGKGEFLYFRITQISEQGTDHAWTAPVWVEGK